MQGTGIASFMHHYRRTLSRLYHLLHPARHVMVPPRASRVLAERVCCAAPNRPSSILPLPTCTYAVQFCWLYRQPREPTVETFYSHTIPSAISTWPLFSSIAKQQETLFYPTLSRSHPEAADFLHQRTNDIQPTKPVQKVRLQSSLSP